MKRLLAMVACVLLAGWSDGTSRYQFDLTIERDGQAIGNHLGLQGSATVSQQGDRLEGTFSTVVAGKTLSLTFSAPPAGVSGVAAARLVAQGYATGLLACEADAHDGMLLLPDTGCACRDVDFVLAFRCPGADGSTGTSDDEIFRLEGTISLSGVPCLDKPKAWLPGSLKTGYRSCATTTPAPGPATTPAPPPVPIYDEGGCDGSSDSEWDGGCGGYDDGYDDYDSDDGGGGCESSGGDDWSGDESGGCEGDSSSDDSSSQSCEGDAYAATGASQHRKARCWPAWGVNLPTILLAFLGSLALLRRRRRRRGSDRE